jgi:predicted hydrocarbon binding protein
MSHPSSHPFVGARRSQLVIAPASLHALGEALAQEPGPGAARALQEAGYATGVAHAATFRAWLAERGDDAPGELPLSVFRDRVRELFVSLGWGELVLHPESEPATLLEATGWAEWRPRAADEAPACHFSTGMLAGFFGELAGQPLAVLEVEPAEITPGACRFLMGSEQVMDDLYRRLERGEALV